MYVRSPPRLKYLKTGEPRSARRARRAPLKSMDRGARGARLCGWWPWLLVVCVGRLVCGQVEDASTSWLANSSRTKKQQMMGSVPGHRTTRLVTYNFCSLKAGQRAEDVSAEPIDELLLFSRTQYMIVRPEEEGNVTDIYTEQGVLPGDHTGPRCFNDRHSEAN